MLFALLFSAAAHAGCPVPTSADTLSSAISTAEAAYEQMNLDGFTAHASLISTTLACMSDILDAEDAAKVHRISALSAYVRKKPEATTAAFQAELAIHPDAILSKDVAPDGNLLRSLFENARVETEGPTDPIEIPADHILKIDGQHADARPSKRPALAQLISEEGRVIWTDVLEAGEALPDWSSLISGPVAVIAPMVVPESEPPSKERKIQRRRPPSKAKLIAAGGTAVASAALYTAALLQKQAYDNLDNSNLKTMNDLRSLRRSTNAMATTSIGLGVTAVGLAAWAMYEVRW